MTSQCIRCKTLGRLMLAGLHAGMHRRHAQLRTVLKSLYCTVLILRCAVQASGLKGQAKSTHPYVRLRVGKQQQLTSIKWSTLGPSWEGEPITFKCAAVCWITQDPSCAV